MSFGVLQGSFNTLRLRLAAYVGRPAISEITIEPPKGNSDELSFIRLVAWGYIFLNESGKDALNFLRQLPPWNASDRALLPHVQALRTWTSHNLSIEKIHDLNTYRTAIAWLSPQTRRSIG